MLRERGLFANHVTIYIWIQQCAPEINRRMRPHLNRSGTSYRLDETYLKVGTGWKYLYRAVDSTGQAIEFMRERQARHYRGETLLQEDDESRSPPLAVHHRHEQTRFLP